MTWTGIALLLLIVAVAEALFLAFVWAERRAFPRSGHEHRWTWTTWRIGSGPVIADGRCGCGATIHEVRRGGGVAS